MTAEEYEKNILSSKKTTVLQVMPGWYLTNQGIDWPGWSFLLMVSLKMKCLLQQT